MFPITDLTDPASRTHLASFYRHELVENVLPFRLRHGLDHHHGGIFTALDRDGSLLDTDKSIWFQGRAGWMFAILYTTCESKSEWLAASRSCVEFLRKHGHGPGGKMWFTATAVSPSRPKDRSSRDRSTFPACSGTPRARSMRLPAESGRAPDHAGRKPLSGRPTARKSLA